MARPLLFGLSAVLPAVALIGYAHHCSVERTGRAAATPSRDPELDERLLWTHSRAVAASRVAARLTAGETTLLTAATELDALLAGDPLFRAAIIATVPGITDRERITRLVVKRAVEYAEDDPELLAEVVHRLDGELAALYPEAGTADHPPTATNSVASGQRRAPIP